MEIYYLLEYIIFGNSSEIWIFVLAIGNVALIFLDGKSVNHRKVLAAKLQNFPSLKSTAQAHLGLFLSLVWPWDMGLFKMVYPIIQWWVQDRMGDISKAAWMVDDANLLMPANCSGSLTFPTLSHTLMMLAIIQRTLLDSSLSDEMKHKWDVMQLR